MPFSTGISISNELKIIYLYFQVLLTVKEVRATSLCSTRPGKYQNRRVLYDFCMCYKIIFNRDAIIIMMLYMNVGHLILIIVWCLYVNYEFYDLRLKLC